MIDKIFKITSIRLAIISGILIGISYPPFYGITAWFGFVPLIHIWLSKPLKKSMKLSFLSGLVANFIAFHWIGFNTGASLFPVLLSMVGAVLYLSSYWLIFSILIYFFHKKTNKGLISIPLVFVLVEWLRSYGPLAFPWADLSITQSKFLYIIQILDLTGPSGISFWLLVLNAALYSYLKKYSNKNYMKIGISIIILFPILYGIYRLNQIDHQKFESRSISIVQPNIDPNKKWNPSFKLRLYEIMDSLNTDAYDLKPDLVLWPESALPDYMRVSSRKNIYINKVKKTNIPILMGTLDYKKKNSIVETMNSSIYFGINGNKLYNKLFLVPFAESIPFSNSFKFLKNMDLGLGSFTQGKEFTLFPLDSIVFSNMICYDSSSPSISRSFVNNGARFISIQANVAWLQNSSGVRQYFQLAILRAVEQRIGIVQSANTGISGFIHPSGRIKSIINLNEQGILIDHVELNREKTFYAIFGNFFPKICLFLLLSIGLCQVKYQD